MKVLLSQRGVVEVKRKFVMPANAGIQVTDVSVIPLENGIQMTITPE